MRLRTLAMTGAVAGTLVTGVALVARSADGMQAAAQNENKTVTCTLKITGMTCAGCEAAVKMAATKADGVNGVKVRPAAPRSRTIRRKPRPTR